MPSVADILVQEILSSLRPAVADAVQRAFGGSSPASAQPAQRPQNSRKTSKAKAKPGVYIVGASRGRLPDWLKAAAKAEKSSELSAKWKKGTELHKGATLPPVTATPKAKVSKRKPAASKATKLAPKAATAVEAR